MPIVVKTTDINCDDIKHYIECSLEHVRKIEHKLTEVLEIIETKED